MKVTVRDCLTLPAFKEARILAGKPGLDNRVSAVSFLEPDQSGQIQSQMYKEDEMVLAAFSFEEKPLESRLKMIEDLSGAGAAALVLLPVGVMFREVNPNIIALADRLDLPVICLPSDAQITFSDIVNVVMEKVLYGDNFGNRLISNTIYHLLNFEKHSSFQSAAREAAINNNFQLVILSEDFNPIFSVETRYRTTIAEAIRAGIERDVNKSMVYTKIDINGALTYWGPVLINGEKHYMFIVDNEDSYSPGEITKLAEIVEIAIGMWKFSPVKDAKADFLKALRRGNRSLAYSLKEEAEVAGKEILSVFSIEGLEKDDCFKKISIFEKKTGYEVLKIHEGDEVWGMILEKKKSKTRESAVSLYQELQGAGAETIFHVTNVEGIEGSADAYQLINESWTFIKNIFPHKNLFTKYELALASNCINISIKNDSVKKNYMDLLEPFKIVGEGKGRQLLETLEIFVLDAGMNTSKTANMMGIHTNTVQYRLKRIKEILQADMMGTTIMPGLTVALAIERIEKITKKL